MTRIIVLLTAGVALLASGAYAHHSFPSAYLRNEVRLEGELLQVLYRNPHSFVQILARDSRNELRRWSLEWDGRARLGNQGITVSTLKPGDHVVVTGFPSSNRDDPWLRMRSIHRPKDGWRWAGMMD